MSQKRKKIKIFFKRNQELCKFCKNIKILYENQKLKIRIMKKAFHIKKEK